MAIWVRLRATISILLPLQVSGMVEATRDDAWMHKSLLREFTATVIGITSRTPPSTYHSRYATGGNMPGMMRMRGRPYANRSVAAVAPRCRVGIDLVPPCLAISFLLLR